MNTRALDALNAKTVGRMKSVVVQTTILLIIPLAPTSKVENPMNLEVLLEQAKEKALESNCRVPMVCFLLRSNKLISYGVNKKGFRGASIHAEIDCLRKIRFQKRRGKNTTMIIIRHRKDGLIGLAKPCANCIEVLRGMGIKNVAWTTSHQTIEFANIDFVENNYLTRPCEYHGTVVEDGLTNFSTNGS